MDLIGGKGGGGVITECVFVRRETVDTGRDGERVAACGDVLGAEKLGEAGVGGDDAVADRLAGADGERIVGRVRDERLEERAERRGLADLVAGDEGGLVVGADEGDPRRDAAGGQAESHLRDGLIDVAGQQLGVGRGSRRDPAGC